MSSETSTEPHTPLQPWQLFTLAGLVGATIVVFLSRGQPGRDHPPQPDRSSRAAAVGVAAWRMFSPLAGIDEPAGPQIFGGRTRAALEREKALVLRSIKELEFDHAMGKVSEKDFAEMGARLRARAAGLMRQLDAGTTIAGDQAEIEKRRRRRAERDPPSCWPAAVTGGRACPARRRGRSATKLCLSCCTPNDPDARFCKGCGYSWGTGEHEPSVLACSGACWCSGAGSPGSASAQVNMPDPSLINGKALPAPETCRPARSRCASSASRSATTSPASRSR